MISRAHITAWQSIAPWLTDAQIEQDLVLSRAIVELFSDAFLAREVAFRGGTALHKLHFKRATRYSEDIDLVQVNAGPIGPIMDAVRRKLDGWLGNPRWKQGRGRATFYYRFQSEMKPFTPLRLKVETNTREHFFVLGPHRIQFDMASSWYSEGAEVLTYEPEELLGTKLRALYQRKKGRDLFDLSEALTGLTSIDPEKVVRCFRAYLETEGRRVTRAQFERNLASKIRDKVFLSDVPPLLERGASFDPRLALERVREAFIARLPEGASSKEE